MLALDMAAAGMSNLSGAHRWMNRQRGVTRDNRDHHFTFVQLIERNLASVLTNGTQAPLKMFDLRGCLGLSDVGERNGINEDRRPRSCRGTTPWVSARRLQPFHQQSRVVSRYALNAIVPRDKSHSARFKRPEDLHRYLKAGKMALSTSGETALSSSKQWRQFVQGDCFLLCRSKQLMGHV